MAVMTEKIGRKGLKNEFKIEIEITKKLISTDEFARQNSVDWSEIFPGLIKIDDFPKTSERLFISAKTISFLE